MSCTPGTLIYRVPRTARQERTGQGRKAPRQDTWDAQSEHELLRRYPTATWSHTSSVAASHMAMMASSHAHGGICSNSKPMHDAIIYVLLFLVCLRYPGLTQKRRMSAHSSARTHTHTYGHGHTRTERETRNLVGFSHPQSARSRVFTEIPSRDITRSTPTFMDLWLLVAQCSTA